MSRDLPTFAEIQQALSESEALLRAVAEAMGWGHKPREEWDGIPDAIRHRSEQLFAVQDRTERLEATIRKLSAKLEEG